MRIQYKRMFVFAFVPSQCFVSFCCVLCVKTKYNGSNLILCMNAPGKLHGEGDRIAYIPDVISTLVPSQ